MKITEAENLIRTSKNAHEFEANMAVVADILTRDNAKVGMRILNRTGLLGKIQKMSDATANIKIITKNDGKYIVEGERIVAPLVVMPLEYYMATLLNLKDSRFYNVYRCLLDSADIYATLAITDSLQS
ncbi:hypothetical protein [Bdellovibrio sp. BCCA]|uniref:hypothetical protein n=1 Tax=Bdellovibrio sp. BCCA TaxID=3136281 RepID=UPI0030F2D91D